jgi:hypothetical protein
MFMQLRHAIIAILAMLLPGVAKAQEPWVMLCMAD